METVDKEPKDFQEDDVEKVSESYKPECTGENDEPGVKRNKIESKFETGNAKEEHDGINKGEAVESQQIDLVTPRVGLRRFKRIPIFVVDYHNHILVFIYRCLGSRHLPFKNNTLLHFDSHPDMVISREIPARAAYDKEIMLSELSIENWIMPSCYVGHFNRVIWVKNSWCRQMPLGKYNFKVGHKKDIISVDCSLDYFISEGNYCPTAKLKDARDLELQVVNADAAEPPNPKVLLSAADSNYYILDIDLDFFSTANPFLEIYKAANCYMQLSDIFQFESATGENVTGTSEKRKKQLESLKAIFEHLEETRTLDGLKKPSKNVLPQHTFNKIEKLVNSLHEFYLDDEIDWLLVYDSGSTTDTNGLPHHISTDDELSLYYKQFKEFLTNLPRAPVLVTIACSAEDDYCPNNQVNSILENVLEILENVFGDRINKEPIMYNKDDKWDVMKL